tara:strand:- start:356 stop:844 length:489 start_codon:yes stop_codon:yes gene_type:complete
MLKILYIIFFSIIVSNCTTKPVSKHHGVPFLEKKQAKLLINKTNKNDILEILGSPSTKSKFDNDLWIYIERVQTQSKLKHLGRMKISKNNVLVLEIDNYGMLKKKEFFNKDDMKNLKIIDTSTENIYNKKTFIYDFMSSMRQKMNDPLGTRAKKRREIVNQR